jgi:hypothetical protein
MKSRPPLSPLLEQDEFLSDEGRLTLAILQDNLMLASRLFDQGIRPEEVADGNSEPRLIDLIAMSGSIAMLRLLLANGVMADRDTLRRAALWEATPTRLQYLCRQLNVAPAIRRQLKHAETAGERWSIVFDWFATECPVSIDDTLCRQ